MIGRTNASVGGNISGRYIDLEVVGGTSRPEGITTNTIWVNTSTPVTGWTISFDQPSNPANGNVWIRMNYQTGFIMQLANIPQIDIGVWTAQQYVNGSWTTVSMEAFTDYENFTASLILYYYGNFNGSYPFGWVSSDLIGNELNPGINLGPYAELYFNSDNFRMRTKSSGGCVSPWCNFNSPIIDLTEATSIIIEHSVAHVGTGNRYWFSVSKDIGSYKNVYTNAALRNTWLASADRAKQYATIDVTSLTGLYYINIGSTISADNESGGSSLYIYSIEVA